MQAESIAGEAEKAPVVGVLCMDVKIALLEAYESQAPHSYINETYKEFLESAGARVVPIWNGREQSYYEDIMAKINGVLMPGGGVFFSDEEMEGFKVHKKWTNNCILSAQYIYEIATKLNDSGDPFPLFGICLGFQLLLKHAINNGNLRRRCKHLHCARKVKLVKDYQKSRLFENLPESLKNPLHAEAFAIHQHMFCITPDCVTSDWRILATQREHDDDEESLEFVTLIEHKSYPYFGSQFHFEKLYGPLKPEIENKIQNKRQCIELSSCIAKVFVQACRASAHRFDSIEEEERHLIDNFSVIPEEQCYLFKKDAEYAGKLDG